MATINCFPPFRHKIPCALCLALDSTGNSNAARIAMMAMTTSNSISVKARRGFIGNNDNTNSDLLQSIFACTYLCYVRRCRKPDKLFGIISLLAGEILRRKLLVRDDVLVRLGGNKITCIQCALSELRGLLQEGSQLANGFGGGGFVLPFQDCFEVGIALLR